MLWKGRRQNSNVEDRRGRMPKAVVGGGIGTILLALAIYFLGGDPSQVLNVSLPVSQEMTLPYQGTVQEQELAEFVSVVLADTEDVWEEQFRQKGKTYQHPKLVLCSGSVESACGISGAATGQFYPWDVRATQKLVLQRI